VRHGVPDPSGRLARLAGATGLRPEAAAVHRPREPADPGFYRSVTARAAVVTKIRFPVQQEFRDGFSRPEDKSGAVRSRGFAPLEIRRTLGL